LYPDALSKFLVQCDQQNDARNQDNERDKKMAVSENGFRSLGKSQWNLQGQVSFVLHFTAMRWFVHSASVCAVATRVHLLPTGYR
jgi:hypothetical protein